MSSTVDTDTPVPAPSRIWGSELLLRKVPLYAQARQYASIDPDEPEAEGNTLSYGVSSYPLLAAVRAAYDTVSGDEKPDSAPSSLRNTNEAAVINRSAFCDIHRVGYAHVPARRKWMSTAALQAGVAASTATASNAVVRPAAAAAVLDDALGPPTLAQVLEPWFGMLEDHLTEDAQAQHDVEAAQAELNRKKSADKKRDASAAEEKGDDDIPNKRIIDPDLVRCQRRKRLYERETETRGAVYTRVESALMHYRFATAEEKDMLHSVRVAGSSSGGGGGPANTPEAHSAAAPPETWGARMLALVASTVANDSDILNDEKAEQQQKVLAYLKRVRWITAQWGTTRDTATVKDTAATPSWGQMTEAARVQAEMAHTQGQRRRFRRTRRGSAGGANNADEDNVVDE
jgi:Skp family chaperone for outer membrane proteins